MTKFNEKPIGYVITWLYNGKRFNEYHDTLQDALWRMRFLDKFGATLHIRFQS